MEVTRRSYAKSMELGAVLCKALCAVITLSFPHLLSFQNRTPRCNDLFTLLHFQRRLQSSSNSAKEINELRRKFSSYAQPLFTGIQ
jgi:hypothetical protein